MSMERELGCGGSQGKGRSTGRGGGAGCGRGRGMEQGRGCGPSAGIGSGRQPVATPAATAAPRDTEGTRPVFLPSGHPMFAVVDAARACRQVALVGASTPMAPEVFRTAGVTLLSGVVVTAPAEVIRVVSEGSGMRQLSPHVRKVTMKVSTLAPTPERPMK